MTSTPETNVDPRQLRKDLGSILGDGASFSLMVGWGETFLPAFILFLGMSGVSSGLVVSLPMLGGALLQLVSPWAVRRFRSYRQWVVLCAVLQALSLFGLVAAGMVSQGAGMLAMAAATLYWGAGLATGPAWNAWVEKIVPKPMRALFFGRRARFCQAALLVGFVTGGIALDWGKRTDDVALVFALLFTLAAACRLLSALFLWRQSEPADCRLPEASYSLGAIRGRIRTHAGARLLMYLLAAQTAVQIAGPFYTPFMLRRLEFSFSEYTMLIAAAFVAKAVMSPFYGRLAGTLGARGLLWIGGAGIVPVAGMWVFDQSFWYLAVVQTLSGMAWAAFELAMFLMFFDAVPPARRTSILSLYNLGNALALVTGALIGAALLSLLGESYQGYLLLFGLSSIGRAASLVLLVRVPAAVGSVEHTPAVRTIALRPDTAGTDRLVLPTLDAKPSRRAA